MKNFYIALGALATVVFSFTDINAQTEGASFTLTGMGVATPFASDYQALGINPGNLDIDNRYDRSIAFGFLEGGLSLYSEVLTKPELRQNIFQEKIKDFSQQQKREYALAFANSKNAVDVDITTFGFSLQTNKAGTFAFSTRERMDYYSQLGNQVSDLMWLGYNSSYFDSLIVQNSNGTFDTIPNSTNIDPQTQANIIKGITALQNAQSLSKLIQGTIFKFSWMQEINLGWGKRILNKEKLQLHAGLGVKALIGRGMTEIIADGGTTQVFGALSPLFGIDYGDISKQNPSAIPEDAGKLTPVGMGFGVDLGATAILYDKFIVSAAVNDIGSVTWDGNVYTLKDISLTSFENGGLESVDFVEQVQNLNGSDGLLEWQGTSKRTTKLPSTMRAGFAFDNREKLRVGIDFIAPLSNDVVGSMANPVIAVGGEFTPLPWIHLQAGLVQGGNYETKIPIGVYFTLGKGAYEFGVSSRDMVTFFRDNQPTVSMAFGFLRFRV